MKDFWRGVIIGVAAMLALGLVVLAFRFFWERDRKIYEYMEGQREIQSMREDIGNRPLDEFLEESGVRGTADDARDDFQRKRDEALQRFRNRRTD